MSSVSETGARRRITTRRTSTLTSIVRDAIEDMIMKGELLGGDRINESALAERLSVSRGPIREACRALAQAGLVRNVANHGAFVRELSLEEARELYELRAAIASFAARLVVERAPGSALAAFEGEVDAMDAAIEAHEAEQYYKLNLEFHTNFIQSAMNSTLLDAYQAAVKQLYLARRRGLVDRGRLIDSNAEHRAIIVAARARDADGCAAAVRLHISEGWKSYAASF